MQTHLRATFHEHRDLVVSLCFPIFFHPDCTVGFGVSPNHALRLVGCTTGRESHPALKILDSISGSIIAWYIIECKPFLKPGQNRDGTTFRRRTLSRGPAPSRSLSFCQSFQRVFLQAAESGVFSKVRVCEAQRKRELAAWQAEQAHHTTSKEKQSVPDGERPVVHIAIVCGFFRVRPIQGCPLFLFYPHSSAPWRPAAFHRRMQVVFSKKQASPKEPSQGSFGEAVIKRRIMKDKK